MTSSGAAGAGFDVNVNANCGGELNSDVNVNVNDDSTVNCSTRPPRARLKRQTTAKIVTCNGISFASALAFAGSDKGSLYCVQELLRSKAASRQCVKEANREGWHAEVNGSYSTGEGLSSGVALLSEFSKSLVPLSVVTPKNDSFQCFGTAC